MAAWCDECEQQLATDDNGQDLSSCKTLLVRHENLAKQIVAQQAKLDELASCLTISQTNFMLAKMQASADSVRQRYAALHEPCQIRRENLDESLVLFSTLHELDDFEQWAQERLPGVSAETADLDMEQARTSLKHHEQLEQEMQSQAQLIQTTLKSTRQLVERKHFAHVLLAQRISDLEQTWLQLKQAVTRRTEVLQDALAVQQFYAECEELLVWLRDKESDMSSTDYGKNDAASLSMLKKLQTLSNDLKVNQKTKFASLTLQAQALQARGDPKAIGRKLAELESLISKLLNAGGEREFHLNAMLRVFEFERECEQTIAWLKDQEV